MKPIFSFMKPLLTKVEANMPCVFFIQTVLTLSLLREEVDLVRFECASIRSRTTSHEDC